MVAWQLTTHGKLFHSGLPHKSVNPMELAMEALAEIQKRFYRWASDMQAKLFPGAGAPAQNSNTNELCSCRRSPTCAASAFKCQCIMHVRQRLGVPDGQGFPAGGAFGWDVLINITCMRSKDRGLPTLAALYYTLPTLTGVCTPCYCSRTFCQL